VVEPELDGLLNAGERLIGGVPAQGFFASGRVLYPSNPQMILTDQRLVLLSRRGAFKKRLKEDSAWSLDDFTERLNSNEGTALGPFLYVLTLFTVSGETVSAGFRSDQDREQYKSYVVEALGSRFG
jgi:hypothetical protein